MNHEILKNVIFDQHRTIMNTDIVKRPGCSFDFNINYIVVGLRRTGKSTLLYSLVKDLIKEGID